MKLDRRTVLSGTVAAIAIPALAAFPAHGDAKRQSLVDSCLETARKVLGSKDFPDAAKFMTNARGVLIIPELVQGGFILGAAGGRGVLMARRGRKDWSPPASTAWHQAAWACRSALRCRKSSSSSAPRRA